MDKVIITSAITGSRISRKMTPYIPITPEEITESAIECWRAGSAIAHIHVRNPETGLGSLNLDLFRKVVEPLRQKTDLIICLTSSSLPEENPSVQERLGSLKLSPELLEIPAGSINLAGNAFINSPDFLEEVAKRLKDANVKPELAILDVGMIVTCLRMRDKGMFEDPLHFQLVLGTPWGAPATLKCFSFLLDHIPKNATWSIAGRSGGSLDMHMLGLISGGHIRVGMEDDYYFQKGMLANSNAQLVERIVKIARDYGREIATPQEARKILAIAKPPEHKMAEIEEVENNTK